MSYVSHVAVVSTRHDPLRHQGSLLMRRLPALLLSLVLAMTLMPTAAFAHGAMADPGEVTVGPGSEFASWTGETFTSANVAGCPGSNDDANIVCDYLKLQVAVDNGFWDNRTGGIEIVLNWENETDDFDFVVLDSERRTVGSAETGGKPERVFIEKPVGLYEIEVQPYTVANSSYEGTITFTSEEVDPNAPRLDFSEALSDQPCIDGLSAGVFPCEGLDLASFTPLANLGAVASGDEGSDIWGWTDPDTGAEIAIMGLTNGTTFVDVTDPKAPQMLAFLDNPSLMPSIWHDIKIIGNIAYIVSESNLHQLQIVDLTRLRDVGPDAGTIEADSTLEFTGDAHNLAANEETGRLYSVGTNACDGGPVVYDTNDDPLNPTLLGCIQEDGYTHDAQCVVYNGPDAEHQDKEICVNSNEDTLTVVDVTSVGLLGQDTVQLSRTGYTNAKYSHQGWFTEDQRYFLLGDELDEQQVEDENGDVLHLPTTTYIWDMADLDAPVLLNNFEHETTVIDHNLYVLGDKAYMSNYTAGLRVQDLGRIGQGQLDEVAWFDTYPTVIDANDDGLEDATFNGSWSNYPYFESGNIIVTGINEGLFIVSPSEASAGTAGVTRLAGQNRFETAVEISKSAFSPGVDTVYVATAAGFADALTGGPLAAVNDAPILLVGNDTIPEATRAEIVRLQPGRIVILGGEVAVTKQVEDQLAPLVAGNVTRIAGADRFETSALIAQAFPNEVDVVGVATGLDFPDALAGGAVAAAYDAPILLTRPEALPAVTAATIKDLAPTTIRVLGGTQAVANEVAVELGTFTSEPVLRVFGADRFATAANIVALFPEVPTTVYIATGLDFPDAVAGTPAAAKDGAPLLLVRKNEIPAATAQILDAIKPTRIVVLGGLVAIDAAVEAQLASYLG